jgi:hypothetical protein
VGCRDKSSTGKKFERQENCHHRPDDLSRAGWCCCYVFVNESFEVLKLRVYVQSVLPAGTCRTFVIVESL